METSVFVIQHPSLSLKEVCIDERIFSAAFVGFDEVYFETIIGYFYRNVFA